ncbi:contactin-5-like [Tropilaelaps mercedesae]|uniref:Contactin-5-like n=1 Tax=Tropilaelaps mercedesae TaxID=418985 RepID=A0A1V9X494_9ACAR|nr:contactin-5-like [Tropilaelaps mercedesae]
MSMCGNAHMLEMRESTRASYRCEISINGSFPLRLVSRRAESIATTIGDFAATGSGREDRHVQVMEGATGVIPCGPLPASEPPAVPVLMKDLRSPVDLAKNSRFHVMPSGNVYVRRAQSNDSGAYRCFAENPLTKERREAPFRTFLVVQPRHAEALRMDASIVHRPPFRVEAVVGSNVTLECLGDGWPEPTVTWQRVGSYLPGLIDSEGTLTLTSVIAKYNGVYECSVSNRVTRTARTTLVVHEPPLLRESSQAVFEVELEQSVSLDCELVRGEPRPNITWLFNGERLRTQARRHVFVHDNEVHISKARKEWHQGHYQCFASNVLGQTYVQFLVRVISSSRDSGGMEPSTALNAGVESARQRKHQRLDQPMRSRLPAPPRPQGSGEQWRTPDAEIEPTARSFRINGLAPRKYRFRLLTVFDNQDHRSGKPSEWISVNATTKADNETTTVTFVEPTNSLIEPPQLSAAPESLTSIIARWSMTRSDSLPWSFSVVDLVPAQYYELKIAAYDQRGGVGNFSPTIVARTLDAGLIEDPGRGSDHPEQGDNALEPSEHDLLQFAVYKRQALIVFVLAGFLGVVCLVFLACVIYYGRRLAGDRIADERVRRQREAAAYVNDANSTFTPSISTVDLESNHGQPLEQTLEGLDEGSDSSSDSLSMKSVSHEEVPRSEKEYALKILTQLYATGSGHIVNMTGNYDLTRVQSV